VKIEEGRDDGHLPRLRAVTDAGKTNNSVR
jgi:hypothetical protein